MTGGVLLVGEANPYGGRPEYALWDEPDEASGNRLRLILGLQRETYRALHRTNLCPVVWSLKHARAKAAMLVQEEPSRPWDLIVMLGRKVATAFAGTYCGKVPIAPFAERSFQEMSGRSLTIVALPHPSGRCLEWNRAGATDRARALLAVHAPGVPWGEVSGL